MLIQLTLPRFLKILEILEGEMNAFYAWAARSVVGDTDAAAVFSKLANEELRHRALIVDMTTEIHTASTDEIGITFDKVLVDQALAAPMWYRGLNARPRPGDLIEKAIAFENGATEGHAWFEASGPLPPQFTNLLAMLRKGDEHHVRSLNRLLPNSKPMDSASRSVSATAARPEPVALAVSSS